MSATPIPSDGVYPVRMQQRTRGAWSSRRNDCETLGTLECRNVADVRAIDNQESHLCIVLTELYPKQTRTSGITFTLTPEQSRALSRELWPHDAAMLRDARAAVAELIHAATLARNALDATGNKGGAYNAINAALAHFGEQA